MCSINGATKANASRKMTENTKRKKKKAKSNTNNEQEEETRTELEKLMIRTIDSDNNDKHHDHDNYASKTAGTPMGIARIGNRATTPTYKCHDNDGCDGDDDDDDVLYIRGRSTGS